MPTAPTGKRNQKTEYRVDIPISTFTEYFPVNPAYATSVQVTKGGVTVTIASTLATKLSTGGNITDFSAADVPYHTISADTDDYFAGDSRGISCIKLSGTIASAVKVVITQF